MSGAAPATRPVMGPVTGPAEVPNDSRATPAAAEHRILQLDGRRYSIRLEPVFWAALEASAERHRVRLNHLIARLAAELEVGGNLASTLRVHCLRELDRLAQAHRRGADRTSLVALVDSAPTPCLMVGHDRRIVAANDAFVAWLGGPRDDLIGEPVLRRFRFRGIRAFDELWRGLGRQWLLPESMRIINIEPGRVLAANATLVPVLTGRTRPSCLVWVVKDGRRG